MEKAQIKGVSEVDSLSMPDRESIRGFLGRAIGEFVVLPAVVFLWFKFLVGGKVPLDRIISTCGLVVQVDAFLLAGLRSEFSGIGKRF
jgi:hypothetical protein